MLSVPIQVIYKHKFELVRKPFPRIEVATFENKKAAKDKPITFYSKHGVYH